MFSLLPAKIADPLCMDLLRVLGPSPVGIEVWSHLWVDLCSADNEEIRYMGILLVSALTKVAQVAKAEVLAQLESNIYQWAVGRDQLDLEAIESYSI